MSGQFKHAIFKIILCHVINLMTFYKCGVMSNMISLWSCHINVVTCCVLMSHHMSKCHVSFDKSCWEVSCHVMLPHVTKCHITPIPCHAVLICDMAVHHTNSFWRLWTKTPNHFQRVFSFRPPLSLSLSLSLLPLPPPPTVRVRQREGWRGTGKRESLVRRLLLSFLLCLCG